MIFRLTKTVSKRFFLSWAIVFAGLIGVVSGLAQLFPKIELSIKASAGLIVASAIIAAVYARLAGEHAHLPVDDLVPEEPVSEASISIGCAKERSLVTQVNLLAKRMYPGVQAIPVDRYEEFLTINDSILVCILNRHREVEGYFDILPLRDDFFDGLISGKFGEQDIRMEHILPPSEARNARRLYLAGVAVSEPERMSGKRHASMLFWGLLKYLQHFYCAPYDCELFAEAVTNDGEKMLRRFNFQLDSPAFGRKDAFPLYSVSLSRSAINLGWKNIPKWDGVCRIEWETMAEIVSSNSERIPMRT